MYCCRFLFFVFCMHAYLTWVQKLIYEKCCIRELDQRVETRSFFVLNKIISQTCSMWSPRLDRGPCNGCVAGRAPLAQLVEVLFPHNFSIIVYVYHYNYKIPHVLVNCSSKNVLMLFLFIGWMHTQILQNIAKYYSIRRNDQQKVET
jgi:hypothetical protein